MPSRRSLLAALGGTVAVPLAGCQASSRNDTATSSRSGGGAPAPWVRPSSEADVVVTNATDRELTVSVDIGRSPRERILEVSADWVLENVIENGETPDITVATETGSTRTVEWVAETEDERVAIFTIRPERIEADIELQDDPVTEYDVLGPPSARTR